MKKLLAVVTGAGSVLLVSGGAFAQTVSATIYPANADLMTNGTNLFSSLIAGAYSLISTVVGIAWPWVVAITLFFALLRWGHKFIHI